MHLDVIPHKNLVRQMAVLANHVLMSHHIGDGMTSDEDEFDLWALRLLGVVATTIVIIDMIHGLEEAAHRHGRRTLLDEDRLAHVPVLTKSIQNFHQIVPRDPRIGFRQMDLLLRLQRIPSDAEHLVLVVLHLRHDVLHPDAVAGVHILQEDAFALVDAGLLAGAESRHVRVGRDGLPKNGGAGPVRTAEQDDGFVRHDVAPLVGAVREIEEAPVDKHLDSISAVVQR